MSDQQQYEDLKKKVSENGYMSLPAAERTKYSALRKQFTSDGNKWE